MKASLAAVAALLAIGLAAPAFAQTSAPAPTAPAVTAPAKKAEHKSVAQAPTKKDEHVNKDGAKAGTGSTGSTTAPKKSN